MLVSGNEDYRSGCLFISDERYTNTKSRNHLTHTNSMTYHPELYYGFEDEDLKSRFGQEQYPPRSVRRWKLAIILSTCFTFLSHIRGCGTIIEIPLRVTHLIFLLNSVGPIAIFIFSELLVRTDSFEESILASFLFEADSLGTKQTNVALRFGATCRFITLPISVSAFQKVTRQQRPLPPPAPGAPRPA
jgi:hypothetical protein